MPYLNPLRTSRLFALLALCSLIGAPLFSPFNPPQASGDTGVSILQPGSPNKKQYSFPFNAIDPSAANNPKGISSPGFRGENQMVIYTPAFGASTGTNESGMEAVVSNGIIVRTGGSDNPIPADGFVISAHEFNQLLLQGIREFQLTGFVEGKVKAQHVQREPVSQKPISIQLYLVQ